MNDQVSALLNELEDVLSCWESGCKPEKYPATIQNAKKEIAAAKGEKQ